MLHSAKNATQFPVHSALARLCAALMLLAALALAIGRSHTAGSAVLAAQNASTIPPRASLVMALPDNMYLHLLPLPLGRLDGLIHGQVRFDGSGTRAVFVAAFPGATLSGDWRTLDPVQAFLLDASRKTLTQLTIDGQARSAAWESSRTVIVLDGDRHNRFAVAAPSGAALPVRRMATAAAASTAPVIATGGDGRFFVVKTDGGRYGILQIGARALHENGVANNGAFAVAGTFLAWVDTSKTPVQDIEREGPTDVAPPSFAGSAYADELLPIVPLGHAIYQGAYRNGTVYVAFTHGVRRIVAQTRDLLSYAYPPVPNDLSYTVGDGFGADANNGLYFARPESGEVTYWHERRYVHKQLTLPLQTGAEAALEWSMQRIAPGETLWPPMRPDQDALDTALLQWRLYPVGDVIGERWIASYLGRLMVGDASGRFRFANAPQYPFAVLGRTDDGRLWGAAPQYRYFSQSVFTDAASTLWWSRDGVAWLEAGTVPGDAGAIGLDHRRVWVALTHPWLGRASIQVMPLSERAAAITGGRYAGEQIFFASLPTGFFLVWGATPGRRLAGDQGTLSAFRIDQSALLIDAGMGLNVFAQHVFAPGSDTALPVSGFDVHDGLPFVQPTLEAIAALPQATHVTLVTNVADVRVDPARITLMSVEQERAYAVLYGGHPYPIASVRVTMDAQGALVRRSFAAGVLTANGATERWSLASGRWERTSAATWTSQP